MPKSNCCKIGRPSSPATWGGVERHATRHGTTHDTARYGTRYDTGSGETPCGNGGTRNETKCRQSCDVTGGSHDGGRVTSPSRPGWVTSHGGVWPDVTSLGAPGDLIWWDAGLLSADLVPAQPRVARATSCHGSFWSSHASRPAVPCRVGRVPAALAARAVV